MEVRKILFAHHGESIDLLKKEISEVLQVDVKADIFSFDIEFLKQTLLSYPKNSYDLLILSKPENAECIIRIVRNDCGIDKPLIFLGAIEEESGNNNFFLKSIATYPQKTV